MSRAISAPLTASSVQGVLLHRWWFADSPTRKQRCGGFTDEIKCRPCTTRKVRCSFQDEVKDLRYNPYLQVRPSRSSSINSESRPVDSMSTGPPCATLLPTVAEFGGAGIQPQVLGFSAQEQNVIPTDDELPKEIDSLKSRFVLNVQIQNENHTITASLELLISKGESSLLRVIVKSVCKLHDPKQADLSNLMSMQHQTRVTNLLLLPRVSPEILDLKFQPAYANMKSQYCASFQS